MAGRCTKPLSASWMLLGRSHSPLTDCSRKPTVIFTMGSKEVEIRPAKRFYLILQVDLSIPGCSLFNWLGVLVLVQPAPPSLDA